MSVATELQIPEPLLDIQSARPGPPRQPWAPASLTRNAMASWIQLASMILYSLVITRYIVHTLGSETYGVWTFLVGLSTYADLFYLGLGASLVCYAAQHRATGNLAALARLASVVFTAYVAIAVVLAMLGIVVSPVVPRLFASGLSPELASLASISCIIIGLRLAALFFASAFGGLLFAYERKDVVNWVMIAFTWLRFILIPLSVRGSDSLVSLAAVAALTGWLEAGALAFFSRKVTGGLPVRLAMPRLTDIKPLYAFGVLSFLVQIAGKLVSYSDTTVIGMRLGADAVTVYTLPLQLAEYCRFVVMSLVAVLLPPDGYVRPRRGV